MNNNEIKAMDCRITGKKVLNKITFDGPLTWREIVRTQPEKEEILRNWFNETGNWPNANSTPVFDATDSIIYAGYSLDVPCYDSWLSDYVSTYTHVKKAVLSKTAAKWNSWSPESETVIKVHNHYFIGASDVDTTILTVALENYKKAKVEEKRKEVKKETMKQMLERLHELEEEIKKEL